MKIVTAEVVDYALPLRAPYRTARRERGERRGFLLRLVGEAGPEGLGEAAPVEGRTEGLPEARGALEAFACGVEGAGLGAEELLAVLAGVAETAALRVPSLETPAARAAVATATFDLLSAAEGLPLCAWLSDTWLDRRAPADRVPVNAMLPILDLEATVEAATGAVLRGFGCLKLKVGLDDAGDVERVRAVREVVGPDVLLRLDANGAWSFDRAVAVLRELEDVAIEHVEQPLPPEALAAARRLRLETGIAVAADEAVGDAVAAVRIVRAHAADRLVLKPSTMGGPDEAIRAARVAEDAGLGVIVTTALDGLAGRLAALHTAAALGPGLPPCGLATAEFLAREIAAGEERLEGGELEVPDTPGLGARLP